MTTLHEILPIYEDVNEALEETRRNTRPSKLKPYPVSRTTPAYPLFSDSSFSK